MTNIVDGFVFNSRPPNIMSYFHNVAAQLEPLRRANGYRLQMFGVPPDPVPIPAFESIEYQIRVQPGSWLWGSCFYADQGTDPGGTPSTAQPINTYRIVDACTELPLQDRPALSTLTEGVVVAAGQTQYNYGQNRGVILLPQPYLVSAPGLMNVEVTNGGNFDSNCQLLLLFASPSINEAEYEALRSQG